MDRILRLTTPVIERIGALSLITVPTSNTLHFAMSRIDILCMPENRQKSSYRGIECWSHAVRRQII